MVISVLLITTAGLRLSRGEPLTGVGSLTLYSACGVTYATILFGALWIRFRGNRHRVLVAYVQLVGDCLVATVLVLATGGFDSAFTFLYSLAILNAAVVLTQRDTLILAGVASACYALAITAQHFDWTSGFGLSRPTWAETFPSLLANVLAFFLVGYLGSSLTRQLRTTSQQLTKAEAALVEAEHIHETVLESLPSGVLTFNHAGDVVFLNRAGADILGPDIARSQSRLAAFFPPAITGDRFELELDGDILIGATAAPLSGPAGGGRVVVFQDLTELRALQQQVARADRLRTLGGFSAGLAHELRNPLASINGCLQLLEEDAAQGHLNSDQAARMLAIARREGERLAGLVTAFLTYARPPPPHREPMSLHSLFHDITEAASLKAGAPIAVVGDDVTVYADKSQMAQVAWNLVSNARQALETTASGGQIEVRLGQDRDRGWFIVDDNGPGIADDQRDKIFDPFFTTRADGTGLGLATAHQLVDAQGGELDMVPSALSGAAFRVRLPRRAPSPSPGDPDLG